VSFGIWGYISCSSFIPCLPSAAFKILFSLCHIF
jgi:hypothetical protein